MEQKEKKLQVRNLRVSFRTTGGKVQAVRDISFDLHKGETLAIVGESGSGKSVTSKAILGILAGNAIVEGGEILYDGQDLLKIREDDFYRLRGDKIAMIFQDPLSSLNPIMRIGKQLTEAMLLKGKARQRSCRQNFSGKLKLLEQYMTDANPEKQAQVKESVGQFRKFEMAHTKMHQAYNAAHEHAQDAQDDIEHLLFLIEKNALKDSEKPTIRQVRDFARNSIDPFVVPAEEQAAVVENTNFRMNDTEDLRKKLTNLQGILTKALDRVKEEEPDFFAMGYFKTFGQGAAPTGTVAQQNAFYRAYLDKNFLNAFTDLATTGITKADAKYTQKRREALDALTKGIDKLGNSSIEAFKETADALCKTVDASIDPLDIVKDSAACTFTGSMKAYYRTFYEGKRTNGKKEAKYNRELARAERKAAKGKAYKVALETTVDFDLVKENMMTLMRNLKAHYEERVSAGSNEDKHRKTEKVIDYLQENASGMVYHITKQAAKNKALKLMAEVGISEPRKRYRQYPFEFSGGMRQRIVIAIALAANPDILICDEPTTALDVTIQAQILELINKLKKERELSIIFITHDLGVVANMADQIAVMYAGKIVEYGTSREIFYEPAHPYTWALLSSMPDLDSKDRLEAIPGTPPDMRFPPKGDAFAKRNQYALQIDFEKQPPEFPISETHWAATWLLHPKAPKVEPPKAVVNRIEKMKQRAEAEVASNG